MRYPPRRERIVDGARPYNRVELAGRIVKLEWRTTHGGQTVASVQLAVRNPKGEDVFRVVAFDRASEPLKGLGEGDHIRVIGHLRAREFDLRGKKVVSVEIAAQSVEAE